LNSDGSESADSPIRAVLKEKNYLLNGNARYLAAAPLAAMALVFVPDSEERLYRDAVLTQIYTETNDAQRLQIAGQAFSEIK
jgi:alkylation response protein AidB-like acyl-CoA dehydrogenase